MRRWPRLLLNFQAPPLNEQRFVKIGFTLSQVKSSQIYLYSTFNVQNNSKCFTEIKALQQGAEKALKICKIIERNNLNELK